MIDIEAHAERCRMAKIIIKHHVTSIIVKQTDTMVGIG